MCTQCHIQLKTLDNIERETKYIPLKVALLDMMYFLGKRSARETALCGWVGDLVVVQVTERSVSCSITSDHLLVAFSNALLVGFTCQMKLVHLGKNTKRYSCKIARFYAMYFKAKQTQIFLVMFWSKCCISWVYLIARYNFKKYMHQVVYNNYCSLLE